MRQAICLLVSFSFSVSTVMQFVRLFYIMMYRHLTTDNHLSTHWQISSLSEDEEEEDYDWLNSMPIEINEKRSNDNWHFKEEEEIRLTVLIEWRQTTNEKLKYLWNCFINIDNWDRDEKNNLFSSDTRFFLSFSLSRSIQ